MPQVRPLCKAHSSLPEGCWQVALRKAPWRCSGCRRVLPLSQRPLIRLSSSSSLSIPVHTASPESQAGKGTAFGITHLYLGVAVSLKTLYVLEAASKVRFSLPKCHIHSTETVVGNLAQINARFTWFHWIPLYRWDSSWQKVVIYNIKPMKSSRLLL